MELKSRKDIPEELTWDLSLIYKTEEEMYQDVDKVKSLSERMVEEYKGKLHTPQIVNACLDDYRENIRMLTLISDYCELAVSVDYYDTYNQERNDKISRLVSQTLSMLSFIDSEIAQLSEEGLKQAIDSAVENKCYLQDVLREKPHKLHPEAERVLAALGQTVSAPYQIYNMAKLADMKFGSFTAEGKEYELGYSLFEDKYEYEKSAELRHAAFEAFSAKIREYENVTAAAYNTHV